MSVIIRLQNLPWSANALDIRQYFSGLGIPEGGVHIVGGELGDAFIAFSTDEDARQAFQRNNGKIKAVQITLSLSSRTEMQRVIEAARTQTYSAFMQSAPQTTVPMPSAVPQIRPAEVPEVKIDLSKDSKDKVDKKERKRSRSRDRRDRSRDRDRRDRRHRDRSRSRSRDRRRRRDRSRSRGRSRSRDRRSRDSSRRRSNEKVTITTKDQRKIEPWVQNDPIIHQPPVVAPSLIAASFANNIEELRRNLNVNAINPSLTGNGFQSNAMNNRGRESWPQINLTSSKSQNDFRSRPIDDNFLNDRDSMNNKPALDRGNRRNMSGKNSNQNSFDYESRNQFDTRLASNCCVKLEPFFGAYGDLRRFFHGCFISSRGIKFIHNRAGTRTGIVYVQFGNPQSKVEALARNDENLNGVHLSISHIDDREFDKATDRFVPRDDEDDYRQPNSFPNKSKFFNRSEKPMDTLKVFTCLTVADLPTYVKEQDILKMFSLYPLTSIILPPRGRGGHVAYVKFSSADDAKKAVSETSLHIIEGKPVTVKPCKDEDFEKINEEHEVIIPSSMSAKKFDTDCLSLSGLPLKTNDRDISDFFSDIGVNPTKIHMMNNNFGFNGQAYCEFETLGEAEKAVGKNSSVLGSQLITVVPIQRVDMEKMLGVQVPPDILLDNQSKKKMIDDNLMASNRLMLQSQNIPQNLVHNPEPDRMSPLSQQFSSNNQARGMFQNRNNFEGNSRGRGFMGRGGRSSRFEPAVNMNMRNNMPQDDNMSPPGCTVFMNNIPYKAGTNEILDFFEGYNVTNNVSRRFNPNNTPTDEAKVVFPTPEDAYVAVNEKHMQTIWDRPIYLRQA